MVSSTPRRTLLLLLSLAAVMLIGGVLLARRTESVRLDRDRETLRRFSGAAQIELQRLSELYENHLAQLARTAPREPFQIRREADRLVGIQQFSLLNSSKTPSEPDLHVIIRTTERMPAPAWSPGRENSARNLVILDEARFFGQDRESSGWIDEPGKPLMYWFRRTSEELAVLMIDRTMVAGAVSQWLKSWGEPQFAALEGAGGPDQLRTQGRRILVGVGHAPAERADVVLPLRSRFGGWELASWDLRETRVFYELGTLVVSVGVALLTAALGFLIFNQQTRTAAQAAQRVSFVNRVSHELRSPLTNILLNIDLATEGLDDPPQETSYRLGLVQEEARRLGRLIDNVLTFARREQGSLQARAGACVPDSVIGAVVEQFAASFARHALAVDRSGEAAAACLLDADAFAQILSNLLSNVEKYVPGGLVGIVVIWSNDLLSVTVSDSGPGIPAEAAERVFRPFERLDSRINEGASGTGLGLAIARDLANSMGGSLRLLPSERGASFRLEVPAPLATTIFAVA